MTLPATLDGNHAEAGASEFAKVEGELGRLLHGVGIARLEEIGWIRATGEDRVRWLNGMVTNSIQELKAGAGNYSFALNAQGQIQGDLTTFATEDALLIETARAQVLGMMAMFDRFIIMDDVELQDMSEDRAGLLVAGPQAAALLASLGLGTVGSEGGPAIVRRDWRGGAGIEVVTAYGPLVPRFELWMDAATSRALAEEMREGAREMNGGVVGEDSVEQLRLLEGIPRYGTDILSKHLAQETAQTRALHFSKGCYLGQEIVERIRSRGNVHRTFAGFRLEGPLPQAGTILTVDGKQVGELSSVGAIPLAGGTMQIGLGMVRREAIERASAMVYEVPEGRGMAVSVPLPVRQA